MGRSTRTTEHLVGTRTGVIRDRTVKRRPEPLEWDKELYEAMDFLPQVIDGPVVRPEAGWESTPGGKACDEERSGVGRRGRPFHHGPECLTRQADFRERLREVNMLPAAEASTAMEPAAEVNVNEEPHPPVPGMEFTADEELQAKWAEVVRLADFEAKKDIHKKPATGLLLPFTWVRTVKKGELIYRHCLRPFRRQSSFLTNHRFTR